MQNKKFLDDLTNPNYWGGEESIFALCNIYSVNVRVHHDKFQNVAWPMRSFPDSQNVHPNTLNIIYRMNHESMEYYHYDSAIANSVNHASNLICGTLSANSDPFVMNEFLSMMVKDDEVTKVKKKTLNCQDGLMLSTAFEEAGERPTDDAE